MMTPYVSRSVVSIKSDESDLPSEEEASKTPPRPTTGPLYERYL